MRKAALLLAGFASFTWACSENALVPIERDTSAPVQTDTTFYVLRGDATGWGATIHYRYRNGAQDSIYFSNCRGSTAVVLEKYVRNVWTEFLRPIPEACLSAPIVIPPGGVHPDSLLLYAAEPGHNTVPAFISSDIDGTYRIVWETVYYYQDPPPATGDLVPLTSRYSNAFVLTRPN